MGEIMTAEDKGAVIRSLSLPEELKSEVLGSLPVDGESR